MNIILFDTEARKKLFPLTLTRAIADIRMGILTAKERWGKLTGANVYVLTDPYLQPLYESILPGEYTFIDAGLILKSSLIKIIRSINLGEGFADENGLIAGRAIITSAPVFQNFSEIIHTISSAPKVRRLEWPHQIFQWNEEMLQFDFDLLTEKRISSDTDKNVHLINAAKIFVEEGAVINYSCINASAGPVYIGKNATVMEGCLIRGPLALCEGAVLKMGSRVYGATTIGPYCNVGGEIKNSVLTAYSNKAHDGYLGDSVIGEWCNLGAGTSNSNVKNTAGEVKVWNYFLQNYKNAGIKCGVIMGDYSKTAINTSINTGTIIGICTNVFGKGLTPKVIRNFAWGSIGSFQYDFNKAIKDISTWKKMKNKILSESETLILKHIFAHFNDNNIP